MTKPSLRRTPPPKKTVRSVPEKPDKVGKKGKTYPSNLKEQVTAALDQVGRLVGKEFGDTENPLLVSVRSGARASMPGMMDTVLNLGLNDHTVQGLIAASGNPRFAWDSYRRFVQMYG